MQKEGLEYEGREFALPLATGEGGWQSAWGSLLSWNSASWAGFVWQERRGSSCIIAPTVECDTVSVASPERDLLFSPRHWHTESTSVSSHEAAGAFWWLLNLFCFHYLSKPGKFLNTTNVTQVFKASWVSLCWVIAWGTSCLWWIQHRHSRTWIPATSHMNTSWGTNRLTPALLTRTWGQWWIKSWP